MIRDLVDPPPEWLNSGAGREWKLECIADESAVYRGDVMFSFRVTGTVRYQAGHWKEAREMKQVEARWMRDD